MTRDALTDGLTPIEPSSFCATGGSNIPEPSTNSVEKHPRSLSVEIAPSQPVKKSKSKGNNKENIRVAASSKKEKKSAIKNAAAAADDTDEILVLGRWTNAEKTKLFEWFLGSDSEDQQRRFDKHKKNPGHIYKKVEVPHTECPCSDLFRRLR